MMQWKFLWENTQVSDARLQEGIITIYEAKQKLLYIFKLFFKGLFLNENENDSLVHTRLAA